MPRSRNTSDRSQPSRKRARAGSENESGRRTKAATAKQRGKSKKSSSRRRPHRGSPSSAEGSHSDDSHDESDEGSSGKSSDTGSSSDAQQRKRKAILPKLPKLPAPENVPDLPSELKTQHQIWLSDVRTRHWLSSKRLGKDVPAVTEDQYSRLTALVDDPLWQDEDVDGLHEQTSGMVELIGARTQNTALDQLWRIVPRFMHCTPPMLFEGRNLQVAHHARSNASVDIDNTQVSSPLWSTAFCDWLRQLVVHPFFMGSPALLAVVMQYAVKLRTNDRRRWPVENPTTDSFLDDLGTEFRNPHAAQPSRGVHMSVCTRYRERGKLLPVISTLFQEMETSIRIADVQADVASDPFPPYLVTTSDVKNVVTALDELHIQGAPLFVPAQFNLKWVRSGMRSHNFPSGASGVNRVMRKAYRRSVQAETLSARRSLPPAPALGSSAAVVDPESPIDADSNRGSQGNETLRLRAEVDAARKLIASLRAENEQLRGENSLHESHHSGPSQMDEDWGSGYGIQYSSPRRSSLRGSSPVRSSQESSPLRSSLLENPLRSPSLGTDNAVIVSAPDALNAVYLEAQQWDQEPVIAGTTGVPRLVNEDSGGNDFAAYKRHFM